MSIHFTHCDANWSASGFMRFRDRLWSASGFSGKYWDLLENDRILDQLKPIHPLFYLFLADDTDGYLQPFQMMRIEPELRRIVEKWPDHELDRRSALLLCDGMRRAIDAGENLRFTG